MHTDDARPPQRTIAHPGGSRAALALGIAALCFVAFATLSPIGLRPHVARLGLEHVAAFGTIALLFAVAFPRRMGLVLLAVMVAAGTLELLQLVVPGRHARLLDLAMKLVGAGLGTLAALVLGKVWSALSRS